MLPSRTDLDHADQRSASSSAIETCGISWGAVVELALIEPGCAETGKELAHPSAPLKSALPDTSIVPSAANKSTVSSAMPRSR